MLDHPSAIDRAPSRSDGAPNAGDTGCAQRIHACRAAYLAQAPGSRMGALQTIELGRLRARMGRRWSELRDRVVGLVQQALARELGAGDLYVDLGADLLHVVRVGRGRAEVERHGELLAAEVTAWLWGTVPRGVSLSVRTLPFDPGGLLHESMTAAELRACLDGCAQRRECHPAPTECRLPRALQPRFQLILQLRKRLVSAYRLAAWAEGAVFSTSPSDALATELDEWALHQALQLGREPVQDRAPALLLPIHYATLAGMQPRAVHPALQAAAGPLRAAADIRGAGPPGRCAPGPRPRADELSTAVLPGHGRAPGARSHEP
jgi:hypothetical protein